MEGLGDGVEEVEGEGVGGGGSGIFGGEIGEVGLEGGEFESSD